MASEEVLQRHKQEKKDLQSRTQSLRKSVPKGDKKKKKEVTEQIAQLEKELDDKQKLELLALEVNSETECIKEAVESKHNDNDISDTSDVKLEEKGSRTSRAQRRRDKKASDEAEREKRILEESEKCKNGPKVVELNMIKDVLKEMGLALYDVAADGNCLYCAVNHQLASKNQNSYSITELRKLTANFMKENKDDFIPFMYNDSGEPVSESYFEDYCKEVASTKLWGGQLELKALSNILKCPIKVIQSNGPPTILGEDFNGPELILTYHRHLYSLGEHYNSTVNVIRDN